MNRSDVAECSRPGLGALRALLTEQLHVLRLHSLRRQAAIARWGQRLVDWQAAKPRGSADAQLIDWTSLPLVAD